MLSLFGSPSQKLFNGDCLEILPAISEGSIDLILTSPPYDNLRNYQHSLEWNEDIWRQVMKNLFNVLSYGGVLVWVVNDATIKGSETGTSFKQVLYAKDIGFNLHDTMIWHKPNPMPTQHTRYENSFEYMFVLSKGKPKTTNILRTKSKSAGVTRTKHRAKGGEKDAPNKEGLYITKDTKIKHNVWDISVGTTRGLKHSAPFPLQLAIDHVLSWSKEGDVVLDPFLGSGTTGVASIKLDRNFIGIEKDEAFFELAKKRIENECS